MHHYTILWNLLDLHKKETRGLFFDSAVVQCLSSTQVLHKGAPPVWKYKYPST